MPRNLRAAAFLFVASAVIGGFSDPGLAQTPPAPGDAAAPRQMQATAERLYRSLSPEQRAQATLPFDSPERLSEVFTGGKRPGVQIKTLPKDQQDAAIALLTQFTSDYGRAQAKRVADQDAADPGLGRYYLLFFGTPGKDAKWAWRIAEHHLTLVHVEVRDGQPTSFGPILLGANPPDVWDAEEQAMIDLWSAMSPSDRQKAKIPGPAVSSIPMKPETGVKVADLSEPAREKVRAVVESRLKFFAADIQERVRKALDAHGGVEGLRVGLTGDATKRCRDGGRWDFKLGTAGFLCDYEGSRGHVHFSLKSWEGR